jgi:hypothetical protein
VRSREPTASLSAGESAAVNKVRVGRDVRIGKPGMKCHPDAVVREPVAEERQLEVTQPFEGVALTVWTWCVAARREARKVTDSTNAVRAPTFNRILNGNERLTRMIATSAS